MLSIGSLSDDAIYTSRQQRNGAQSDKQSNQVSAYFKKPTPWNSYHVIIAQYFHCSGLRRVDV